MTAEPSPRPWRVVQDDEPGGGHNEIYDAEDKPVVTFYDSEGWVDLADASLIVEAVNERDSLRDLVRRMLPLAETTVENIRSLGTARFPFLEQIKSDRLRGDINREVVNAEHLLREARAAIGEDKQ